MISTWSEWKRYPRPGVAKTSRRRSPPGIYEVRYAGTGALHSFEAVDNVAQALALLPVGSKSWFGRREPCQSARPRIPHLRDLLQGRRQGRRGTHDRPPRNLYERRGLMTRHSGMVRSRPGSRDSGPCALSISDAPEQCPQNCLKQPALAADALRRVWPILHGNIPRKSEEYAMTPTVAARASSLRALAARPSEGSLAAARPLLHRRRLGRHAVQRP